MANNTRHSALIQKEAPHAQNANKYDPDYCWTVREMAQEGMFPEEWCAHIGITMVTMYNWANRYPDFDQACNEAWWILRAYWSKKARDSIQGVGMAPSILAMILEKRFPDTWGKNPKNTHEAFAARNEDPQTGEDGLTKTPEEIRAMSLKDIDARIAAYQKRRAHDGGGVDG
ncbi:MAG: hypothetical protein AAGD43_29850 [Pseudomonadota bacterium]